MKTLRQPISAISRPPPNVPSAGPGAIPTPISPFAAPSLSDGRCCASSFELHGNAALSPTPNSRRNTMSVANPVATPDRAVAIDQIANPIASVR